MLYRKLVSKQEDLTDSALQSDIRLKSLAEGLKLESAVQCVTRGLTNTYY